MSSADDASLEGRLLMVSVWASAGFAVGSSVWGLLSGSSMIVFDGLYSFVSIGLSLLAVLALRVSRRGPSPDYPWGRRCGSRWSSWSRRWLWPRCVSMRSWAACMIC